VVEAVADRFGERTLGRHLGKMSFEPLFDVVEQRWRAFLAQPLPFGG
jgi:hypothetical protein